MNKHTGKIVGAIDKLCSGGKPDRAQAGGKLAEKLAEALAGANTLV